ncbi:mCG140306, isoform CRA_b [Mus musculus]|nr:mCG140306, isoform CRA_b [Mus musculus]
MICERDELHSVLTHYTKKDLNHRSEILRQKIKQGIDKCSLRQNSSRGALGVQSKTHMKTKLHICYTSGRPRCSLSMFFG